MSRYAESHREGIRGNDDLIGFSLAHHQSCKAVVVFNRCSSSFDQFKIGIILHHIANRQRHSSWLQTDRPGAFGSG
jgi:hypothetical protein